MTSLDELRHYKGKDKKIYAADQWVHKPKQKAHLHTYHRRFGGFESNVKPVYSAAPDDVHPLWTKFKRNLFYFYYGSRVHFLYEQARKNLIPLPLLNFQLHPVIFCLELDRRGFSKKIAYLYDEVFSALVAATHDEKGDKSQPPLEYIATSDVIIMNRTGLKTPNVYITEAFQAFLANAANSVIILADSIGDVSDQVKKAFRSIYTKTSLKDVPLLVLLVCDGPDMDDFNWQDRHASSETVLLRETLLDFGTISMPHKVFFVRSGHVVDDVEHALYWLWRKTGVRGKKKVVPISTSITRKRWGSEVRNGRKKGSVDSKYSKKVQRSSLKSGDPNYNRHQSVRFNSFPVEIGRKVTRVRSLGDVGTVKCWASLEEGCFLRTTKEEALRVRRVRSLDKKAMESVKEEHPDYREKLFALKLERFGRRASTWLLPAQSASLTKAAPHKSLSRQALSAMNLAGSIVENQEEQKLREKFAMEEFKYLELKARERHLQDDERNLRLRIDLLIVELKAVKSNILHNLEPVPHTSETKIIPPPAAKATSQTLLAVPATKSKSNISLIQMRP